MARVHRFDDLRFSPTARLFEGRADGVELSTFVVSYERGDAVGLHMHPYPEVFVVLEGEAVFTIGEERLTVGAEYVVVVPEQTPHGFRNDGDARLRIVSVHPSGIVEQQFLED